MLEHMPRWLGGLLRNLRAGADKLVIVQPRLRIGEHSLQLMSPAFGDHGRLPIRFTADGEGVSPPLVWTDPPEGTTGFCLIVEDPDAPAPNPLVHAVVWGLPAAERRLEEGEIARDGKGGSDGRDVGRHSFLGEGWLPPIRPPATASTTTPSSCSRFPLCPMSAPTPAVAMLRRRWRAACSVRASSSAPTPAARSAWSAGRVSQAPPPEAAWAG